MLDLQTLMVNTCVDTKLVVPLLFLTLQQMLSRACTWTHMFEVTWAFGHPGMMGHHTTRPELL